MDSEIQLDFVPGVASAGFTHCSNEKPGFFKKAGLLLRRAAEGNKLVTGCRHLLAADQRVKTGLMMKTMKLKTRLEFGMLLWLALVAWPAAAAAVEPSPAAIKLPKLYRVPLEYQGVDIRHVLYHQQGFQAAPRGEIQLEIVDMQANHHDGTLWFWAGAAARCLVGYEPGTGETELHRLPRSSATGRQLPDHLYLLANRAKIYLLDLRDPSSHLAVYNADDRTLSFAPLLSDAPQRKLGIVTGTVPPPGRYLYLFVGADAADTSRELKGLIRWDTRTATGEFISYPYAGPGPIFGVASPDGSAIWCPIWNGNALARFDTQQAKWNGFWKTPFEPETQPTSAGILGDYFYCVDLFRPRLMPFDTKTERWAEPVAVPGHGTDFGVLGGGWIYQDKLFCSMATLKGYIPHGGPIGVDGKPWHFLDRRLCYDPRSAAFGHWQLAGSEDEYWMNSVAVQHGPHVYFVAINLAQPDGTVDQFGRGDVAVFQTHPRSEPDAAPAH